MTDNAKAHVKGWTVIGTLDMMQMLDTICNSDQLASVVQDMLDKHGGDVDRSTVRVVEDIARNRVTYYAKPTNLKD